MLAQAPDARGLAHHQRAGQPADAGLALAVDPGQQEPGGGPATVNSMGYLHDGTCVPIEAYDQTEFAKPTAGGPPATGESGGQCANNTDDDADGFVNDGCPAVGPPEIEIGRAHV